MDKCLNLLNITAKCFLVSVFLMLVAASALTVLVSLGSWLVGARDQYPSYPSYSSYHSYLALGLGRDILASHLSSQNEEVTLSSLLQTYHPW